MSVPDRGPSWRTERDQSGTWTFWFDRPGTTQNSLDSSSLIELDDHLATVAEDSGATRLLLRSTKPKGFFAGADLKELQRFSTAAGVEAFANRGSGILDRLAGLRPPTVAIIHGACLGGGLELAMACTYRVVLCTATIGLPEVRLGLVPGWGRDPAIAENGRSRRRAGIASQPDGPSRHPKCLIWALSTRLVSRKGWTMCWNGYATSLVPTMNILYPRIGAIGWPPRAPHFQMTSCAPPDSG